MSTKMPEPQSSPEPLPSRTTTDGASPAAAAEPVRRQPPKLPKGLRVYDSDDDRFSVSRYRKFLLYVIAPSIVICMFMYYLLVVRPTQGAQAMFVDKSAPTSQYGSKLPASPLVNSNAPAPAASGGGDSSQMKIGNSMFNPVNGGSSVDASMQPPPGSSPAAIYNNGPKCYAEVNATGVFSPTKVYQGGLFIVEAFTRVKGGMIFNRRFGWYMAKDFGCDPKITDLEVEFVEPAPTRTPVRVVARPPTAPLPTPIPVYTATPALPTGIVQFSAMGCGTVTWLVSGVKAVYLVQGGQREGVPGDDHGGAVITSVCPYTGTLGLLAMGVDGLTYSRSVYVGP